MWSLLIPPYLDTFIMCADIYNVGRYSFDKDTVGLLCPNWEVNLAVTRCFSCNNKISRHSQEINQKFNPRSTQGVLCRVVQCE